eukprot:c52981_g1_i1.p4 GENE.c52981_g1_i1~~c52981_g1_i1.p4  ORF type:complete len:110 (+),score=16.64 c52981_g1_i1:580-909(+)
MQYSQYVVAISRVGYVSEALATWWEWLESPLGAARNALHLDILRSAMVAAVVAHGDAKTAEELYRTQPGFQNELWRCSKRGSHTKSTFKHTPPLLTRARERADSTKPSK